MVTGRKESLKFFKNHKEINNQSKNVWFHCASLGEFEQGRPLIEKLKMMHPDIKVFLSFFSPSGYEVRKEYPFADFVFYLPSDLPENAESIIASIKPQWVVFVKYEFWWNTLRCLHKNRTPVFLVSGLFRQNQYFFNPFLSPFKDILAGFYKIFTQDVASSEILEENGILNSIAVGDTRIDRVAELSKTSAVSTRLKEYVRGKKVIIYGSVWDSDMQVISDFMNTSGHYIHIIAPHDIKADNLTRLKKYLPENTALYSHEIWLSNILIINNIGLLNQLYSIADIAYIGGGFHTGIHNILEPAVFEIPVVFGPKYHKFREAVDLIELGVAYSVVTKAEFEETVISTLDNQAKLNETSHKLRHYFERNRGATDKILKCLEIQLFNP